MVSLVFSYKINFGKQIYMRICDEQANIACNWIPITSMIDTSLQLDLNHSLVDIYAFLPANENFELHFQSKTFEKVRIEHFPCRGSNPRLLCRYKVFRNRRTKPLSHRATKFTKFV
jgi:hypothetical protein